MKNQTTNDEKYLWDQTGEPDVEIQELEHLLGSLRYQPRSLVIPTGLEIERRVTSVRSFGPRLAIAATIILAVGAGAFWLSFGRRDARQGTTGASKPAAVSNSDRAAVTIPEDVLSEFPGNATGKAPDSAPGNTGSIPASTAHGPNRSGKNAPSQPSYSVNMIRRNRPNRPAVIASTSGRRVTKPGMPLLSAKEVKEAEAGKAQLMMALRVASAKLNFALRKAQGSNYGNLIHNQHKIG